MLLAFFVFARRRIRSLYAVEKNRVTSGYECRLVALLAWMCDQEYILTDKSSIEYFVV